jgi:DNA-binding NarL/FixJ family response regulator
MQALAPSTIRPRVLIADDHSIVADGLRSVLEKSCDVIGIVQDGRELLTEAPSSSRTLLFWISVRRFSTASTRRKD